MFNQRIEDSIRCFGVRLQDKFVQGPTHYKINDFSLTLSRLWYFFGGTFLSSQQLLDPLRLTRHFRRNKLTGVSEKRARPSHKSIRIPVRCDESHMINLLPPCCHNWRCHRLVLCVFCVKSDWFCFFYSTSDCYWSLFIKLIIERSNLVLYTIFERFYVK